MYKVIIVDDEPQLVHGLSTQTDWESHEMEIIGTVDNGQDALDILSNQQIHLLITDVRMPKMDGLELISKAKQLQPGLRCIIVSAYSEFEFVKKAMQLNVENYLLKPINENELHETLTKTLENLEKDRAGLSRDDPDILAFRTNILERWANGTIQDFELYERAELLHIDLSAPEYIVCVLDVLTPARSQNRIHETFLFLEACREALFPAFKGECFLDASFRVIAILNGDKLREQDKELEDRLRALCKKAAGNGSRVFCSIGSVSITSSEVNTSFTEANLYQHYHSLDPTAQVCRSSSEAGQNNAANQAFQNSLMHFEKAIREGNGQQALSYVQLYSAQMPQQSYSRYKKRMLSFILRLVRAMIESGRITDALPEPTLTLLASYPSLHSKEELDEWMASLIRNSLNVIRDRKGSFHLLVRLTLEQVQQHYASNLSLKTLAAGFNVSPAYLGQLFKEETGKFFNDFLTETRLHASRSLLLETNLKIAEIIRRIGIPNQSYFNRLFKKTYGLSPMEFRRQGH